MSQTDTSRDDAADADRHAEGSTASADGPAEGEPVRAEAGSAPGDEAAGDEPDPEQLAVERDLLAAENRRLREEYARARQVRYRRTALGLVAVGLLALLGGLLFPQGRDVLLALAGVGVIGGLLTYTLSPGQYVAADVGERVYGAQARNASALAAALDLRDAAYYLPDEPGASLFVPQRAEPTFPDPDDGPIVTDSDERGLVLEPTGEGLYEAFERAVTADPADDPAVLATQLADAIVEQFELARSATPDVEPGRLTLAVEGSAFGDLDRFDHPIPSLVAVGLAQAVEAPVSVSVDPGEDGEWLVTCRWEMD
ncbi:hypothetical protein [Halovivax limisalsi]|uniref:hypothetical protein n=1 Tax=Halovivax limisalsi TaxID=1453760 RepID=UPI001FFCE5C9|nr:hypothetical protein [Halovivax limisalsi]